MIVSRIKPLLLVCCLVSPFIAGCGGTGSAALSPVAPSPSSSGSGPTISGQVTGPAATARSLAAADANTFHTMATQGVTVSIVGTSVSTVADGNGQFTLTNVPPGTVELNFSAPGSSAMVTISGIGPTDQVQIVVSLSGNTARVESEHHSSPDNKGEFQGRITSIDFGARSFQVSGMTVKVPVSATIRHGSRTVPFADLAVGDHVQVRGTREGTTITATEVKVESGGQGGDQEGDDEDDDHEGGNSGSFELSGAISSLGGTCPTVNFMIGTTKVTTTSATTYEDGTCATLKNTGRVEVKGTKAGDGSITATKISIEDAKDSSTTELKGTMSALAGTCPTVNFMIGTTKVTTSNTTTYEHGTCATLKNTLRVEVKGAKGADGVVAATRISIDD